MDSVDNLMPLNILQMLFPKTLIKYPDKHKDKRFILWTFNKTIITQLGVCT